METEDILLAQERKAEGSNAARRMRHKGILPGIVNNERGDSQPVQLNLHDFEQRLRHHKGENLILDLRIEGQAPTKVLLKDMQHHPVTDELIHVDFVEISMTKKMRVRIQVKLTGEPVGVSQTGGILEHLLREIEVECLPLDLLDEIEIDVSNLNVGDSLSVKDLTIDPKLTVLTADDIAVVSISAPRVEEATEEETASEGEGPAVVGEGDGEGEGKEKKEGGGQESAKEGA